MKFSTTAAANLVVLLVISYCHQNVAAFTPSVRMTAGLSHFQSKHQREPLSIKLMAKKTKLLEREETEAAVEKYIDFISSDSESSSVAPAVASGAMLAATGAFSTWMITSNLPVANAVTMPKELSASFDPSNFVPVCGASDNFYRLLQGTAEAVVGTDNFKEYGPLIASGLLRVRLELCVVESFFNEAVGPFIRENGLSWVLPLHETVETFLAGTVFAIATTFILVGSTKILTVIFTYADFFVGAPMRILGGFSFDRARGRPVIFDIGFGPFKTRLIGPKDLEVDENAGKFDFAVDMSKTELKNLPGIVFAGSVKAAGQSVGLVRELLDAIDLFVGKSLILWATAYIGFKFIHFKVFPDFPF
ncbi:unnamed protein product [Cylindrotheca closterium]|uniref:Plastid lipid-associated protein/fibrillin conserved domain-containing protein n=1 Tax=Cylindrotheca closterium TaxID=2856 RepID=A0AAD2FWS6_9STRA|nr:unnamed protein product [Cylindrotheca closterium]